MIISIPDPNNTRTIKVTTDEGHEIHGIRSITIHATPNQPVTATIELIDITLDANCVGKLYYRKPDPKEDRTNIYSAHTEFKA